jgi:hypothetical protein
MPSAAQAWNSSVGIVTHYRLDGLGIECWRGEVFRTHPDWPWGPPSLLHDRYWVSFPVVEWTGLGIVHPSPPSSEVKDIVALYPHSSSGCSWPVLG